MRASGLRDQVPQLLTVDGWKFDLRFTVLACPDASDPERLHAFLLEDAYVRFCALPESAGLDKRARVCSARPAKNTPRMVGRF